MRKHFGNNRGFKEAHFKSVCGDTIVKGSLNSVIQRWIQLAQDCENENNFLFAERYRQQAEHYVRLQKDLQKP